MISLRARACSRLGCALILGITMAPAASAQGRGNPVVRKAAETIVAADLMHDVTYIASDAMKGRATSSPGLDSAAAYIVRRLKQLGVKPMGDSGTYYQHYIVATARLDTTTTTASMGNDRLAWSTDYRVNSFVGLGVTDGAVVYLGSGLRAPKRGIDSYAGLDIRGKWVLVHASSAPARGATDTLGRLGVDYTNVAEEARLRGAIGILTIGGGAAPAGRGGRGAGRGGPPTFHDLVPSVGRAYAPYPLPQLTLTAAGLEHLLRGEPVTAASVLAADSTHQYPKSFALNGTRHLKVEFAGTSTTVRPYSIVGLVEGSDPVLKNEWITSSTHLDGAVGNRVTASGDSIYNAADDNGSGSAANMSIARVLMQGPRPKRSILLVWDSGEETGLCGSRFLAYSEMAKRVVAHFTVDMIARTKKPGTNIPGQEALSPPGVVFADGPGTLSTVMDSALSRVTREYGFVTFDRRYEDPNDPFFYPRTDAAPYAENGIPYVEFFTGLHEDYHQQTDEVSKLDPVKFEAVARTVYVTLWTVADGKERPRMDKPLPPVLWFVTPR